MLHLLCAAFHCASTVILCLGSHRSTVWAQDLFHLPVDCDLLTSVSKLEVTRNLLTEF